MDILNLNRIYPDVFSGMPSPFNIAENISLLVIDNLAAHFDNPSTRDLFIQTMYARFLGYKVNYPKAFIPFDGSEWIDRHYIFCDKQSEEFQLVGGIKFTSYNRCREYHIPFPLQTGLQLAKTPLTGIFEESLSQAETSKKDIVYAAWGTVHPKYRGKKEVSEQFHRLFAAIYYHQYLALTPLFTYSGAVLKFKSRAWLERMGHKLISYKENPLGIIKNPYSGFEIVLLQMREPSLWAKECYDSLRFMFKSADTTSDLSIIKKKVA